MAGYLILLTSLQEWIQDLQGRGADRGKHEPITVWEQSTRSWKAFWKFSYKRGAKS